MLITTFSVRNVQQSMSLTMTGYRHKRATGFGEPDMSLYTAQATPFHSVSPASEPTYHDVTSRLDAQEFP